MIDKSKLAMIVAAATLAVSSPAFAQSFDPDARTGNVWSTSGKEQANAVRTGQSAARLNGLYALAAVPHARAAAPRSRTTVDRNDPALTGGGSLGYNQTVERGF
jgi:hypothetical protein